MGRPIRERLLQQLRYIPVKPLILIAKIFPMQEVPAL